MLPGEVVGPALQRSIWLELLPVLEGDLVAVLLANGFAAAELSLTGVLALGLLARGLLLGRVLDRDRLRHGCVLLLGRGECGNEVLPFVCDAWESLS